MKILIVETANTETGKTEDILKKFLIARSWNQKNNSLKLFKQPTCTKDERLIAEAERIENLLN